MDPLMITLSVLTGVPLHIIHNYLLHGKLMRIVNGYFEIQEFPCEGSKMQLIIHHRLELVELLNVLKIFIPDLNRQNIEEYLNTRIDELETPMFGQFVDIEKAEKPSLSMGSPEVNISPVHFVIPDQLTGEDETENANTIDSIDVSSSS